MRIIRHRIVNINPGKKGSWAWMVTTHNVVQRFRKFIALVLGLISGKYRSGIPELNVFQEKIKEKTLVKEH